MQGKRDGLDREELVAGAVGPNDQQRTAENHEYSTPPESGAPSDINERTKELIAT